MNWRIFCVYSGVYICRCVVTIQNGPEMIYECEVCSQIFFKKKEFLQHHVSKFGQLFTCCKCNATFKNSTFLYQHYKVHKTDTVFVCDEEVNDEEEVYTNNLDFESNYEEDEQAVMNIPDESINSTNELLYILDDTQCANEVVIEEECEKSIAGSKPDNFSLVQVEHGYMLPSVFKGQLGSKQRMNRKLKDDSDDDPLYVKMEPSTSKLTSPRSRIPGKRRHEVPDFSASDYIVLKPNEEVDMTHYKCLRCEQLFINKFVFYRHIEKGKCFVNRCDVCSAVFSKNSDFYEHYIESHPDRAICNFCFRTFMYEKNVKEHMLRHLDQFRHRCEECHKGFYTVREYRNHYKNRHMGIRHKCQICNRSFADEYYFKRHVATHGKQPE